VGGNLPLLAFDTGSREAKFPTRPTTKPSTEPNTTSGKPFSEASSSKLVQQARRIAQLESRLASLEATQPTATWQCFGEIESVAKSSSEKRNARANGPFLTSPRGPTQPETILFRGKNYKTQYYGGTNPTSLIAHVRIQFFFWISQPTCTVPRTLVVHEGSHHASFFAITCPTGFESHAGKLEDREG
jgi:hypothetical protein